MIAFNMTAFLIVSDYCIGNIKITGNIKIKLISSFPVHNTITYSELTIEALEQGVKYVRS